MNPADGILCGDARDMLRTLPENSVHCVVKAGRRAILIDINPEYAAMARERLAQGALL